MIDALCTNHRDIFMRALLIFSISFVICKRIETGQNSAITATQTGNALIDGLEFYKSVFHWRQNRKKKAYMASSPDHVVKAEFQKRVWITFYPNSVDHIEG